MNRRTFLQGTLLSLAAGVTATTSASASPAANRQPGGRRPNILLIVTDDQSWLHMGAYGDRNVRTPAFDRVAKAGVLFQHAYCASPSCSPSRRALTFGQAGWRLGSRVTHCRNKGNDPGFATDDYMELLKSSGYAMAGIGAKSGKWRDKSMVVAKKYPDLQVESVDYAASFENFLKARPADTPFHYLFASIEPHRGYSKGSGVRSGRKLEEALVPGWLPDTPEIRSDILDYYLEIEHLDSHVARMIETLDRAGELDNTIIAYTADNGMPFPRAKATLYDSGVRMPLAVAWPSRAPGQRKIDDFVGLWDLAPTFLEAAGVPVPKSMYGRSLLTVLASDKSGQVDPSRDFAVTCKEAHVFARPEGTYPTRAIHTRKWAYLRNYEPSRWPSGPENWPYGDGGTLRFRSEGFNDVGNGPSKSHLMAHRGEPAVAPFFAAAFGMRPGDELYDMEADPAQMHNLAGDPKCASVVTELRDRMERHLKDTGDPRLLGQKLPWGDMLLFGRTPEFWTRFYEERMKNNTYEQNAALLKSEFAKDVGEAEGGAE